MSLLVLNLIDCTNKMLQRSETELRSQINLIYKSTTSQTSGHVYYLKCTNCEADIISTFTSSFYRHFGIVSNIALLSILNNSV